MRILKRSMEQEKHPRAKEKIKKEQGAQKNEKEAGTQVKKEQGAKNCKEQEAKRQIVKGARNTDPPNRGSQLH